MVEPLGGGGAAPLAVPLAVAVALPVPLPEALWYSVPQRLRSMIGKGQRVRVPLGQRRRIGTVVELATSEPEGFKLREVEDLLDLEPVLSLELLELGEWIASYYLSPIGEVLGTLVPSKLPATARAKISLTSGGAMAPSLSGDAKLIVDLLREQGRCSLLELAEACAAGCAQGAPDALTLIASARALQSKGLVRIEGGAKRGSRFASAVELMPGDLDAMLVQCGRSAKAKEIVHHLSSIGRPARVSELTELVGCGPAVVRRLVKLGLLREFVQIESLALGRHLGGAEVAEPLILRPDQAVAVDQLLAAIKSGGFRPFLLRGVTGSGKTEVYLRAIEATLNTDRSALILVPEIAMVPSLAQVLRERFGDRVALLHSNLSEAERIQEWERLRKGGASVVVGPRSAALAPIGDLGLVVVDEEHDGAYKQDAASPRYSGRDVALLRAQRSGAVAIVASATPSMEALGRVSQEKFGLLELTQRAGAAGMPTGEVVDLREEKISARHGDVHFSAVLDTAIRDTAAAGQQIILLRNRRGFAPVVLCRACGEDHQCDDCGLPRTLHWKSQLLICHYCTSKLRVPQRCGTCGESALEPIGAGTERVESLFRERFPDISVDVLDRDATQRVGGAARILERFRVGETQALIGTQMVSKGHHFPNVALTGVLSADSYLKFPDFRAVERTYALLTQVVGRSGRGEIPGRFILQTFHPDHYAVRAVLSGDSAGFEEAEMRFRRSFAYPPFSRVVSILLRDSDQRRGSERIRELGRELEQLRGRDVLMNGPAPAPLERLRGRWRFQILLRGRSQAELRALLERSSILTSNWDIVVDVDPQNLL